MEKQFIGFLAPKQDARLESSEAGVITAGRDIVTTESSCYVGVAGRDIFLKKGYGGLLVPGNHAHVENSRIGVLLGKNGVNFQDSKVLFTGSELAVMGVIAGLVCILALSGIKLLRRLFKALF